jgi:hypothetical protein
MATTSGMESDYDAHSEYQRRVIEGGDRLISALADDLDLAASRDALAVADYGAGTGATSVHAVRTAIEAVRARDADVPVLAIHNDLPTSDFSHLFRTAGGPDGYLGLGGGPVFVTAAAGSFFDQVVPDASVDAGLCSNAAHWLREQPHVRVPEGMYFSDATGNARATLAEQAAGDWRAFLTARTAELRPGGRLLVQGIGSTEAGVSAAKLLTVMWQVAVRLADDGKLDRAALDDYVFPVYCRSAEEVAVVPPGLALASVTSDEVANPYWEQYERTGDAAAYAKTYTEFVRAFAAPSLTSGLFGGSADLCDAYFARFEAATVADPAAGRYECWVVRAVFARDR